jgi:hypothetical protein
MKIHAIAAAGLLISSASAFAVDTTALSGFSFYPFAPGPVIATDNASNFLTTVIVTSAPPTAGSYLGGGGFTATFNGTSFEAYCVQIDVPVGIPGVYTDYSKISAVAGFGARADDLSRLVTWAAANALPNNAATAAAMQAAVWEIVHETTTGAYNFSAGSLTTTSQSAATQSALNAINWVAIAGTAPSTTVERLDSPNRQDLLIFAPIPEAGTMAMMMLGVAGLGAAVRRRPAA